MSYPKTLKKGFTVVELLLYMAIMTVFLTVLTDIFTSVSGVKTESEMSSSVAQDNTFILARLMYDIQRANSIIIPSAAGLQSTSMELSIGGGSYTYALNNGNLELTSPAGSDNLNGFNTIVSGLNFARIGNGGTTDTIQISYTITSRQTGKSGSESKTVQTTVGLR